MVMEEQPNCNGLKELLLQDQALKNQQVVLREVELIRKKVIIFRLP